MRILNTFLIFAAFFAAPLAGAQTLSDATYLRKLSLHLRGIQPTAQEYAALAATRNESARQDFLKAKIDEYLQTPDYQDRMIFRLSERFQVRTPNQTSRQQNKLPQSERNSYGLFYTDNSLANLFRSLTERNLSWDTLLTGKEYTLFPRIFGSSDDATDFKFYKYVSDVKLPKERSNYSSNDTAKVDPIAIKFADDDERIAGALTTPRFINRYNTTNTNRNRRRAAAVFRIFLCDPMVPVIPPPPDKKAAVLNRAFADEDAEMVHTAASEDQLEAILRVAPENRHGTDRQCAACHYKLDPMGKTFQNIGIALNPLSSPGALVFNRVKEKSVNTPVEGIGSLAKEIVKQPEYVNCQVQWFWDQFIGKDVTLKFARRAELAAAFEQVGRRTNDFVRILVSAPEFRQRQARVEHVLYEQVQPLLKRCDSCHNGGVPVGELSEGQISKFDLLDARQRLNLPESDTHKMPRNWPSWNPEELTLLKRWIDEGAFGADGKAGLTAQDLGGS